MIGINANKFHHGTTFLAVLETSLGTLKWVSDTDGQGKINAKFEMAAIEPEIDTLIQTLNQMGLQDCALELTRARTRYAGIWPANLMILAICSTRIVDDCMTH